VGRRDRGRAPRDAPSADGRVVTGLDVAAVADRARRAVDIATWVAIGLGLAFTAVNVQTFAAAGSTAWSPAWLVAWLLDPMVSVLLLAVVRAEQVTARWQVTMPWPVTATKWAAFAATYAMNTWASWRDQLPSGVVLHSVPPVFVLLAAEVAPALRDRLTEAVRAAELASRELFIPGEVLERLTTTEPVPADEQPTAVGDDVAESTADDAPERDDEPAPVDARVRELAELLAAGCEVTGAQAAALHEVSTRTGRRLLADARTHLEQHPTPTRRGLHLVAPDTAGGTA
jgi:hypothetical protein